MPRYLYLLRHAQSADKQPGQTDLQRILTPTGIKQAMQMGAFFRQQNILPERIISSTAERAKATAHLVAEAIGYDFRKIHFQEDLYDASTRSFFNYLTSLDDKLHHVLCVAHNPTLSYLAEYLTKAHIGDIVPAGMAIIHFNLKSWKEISEGNGEFIRYFGATE